MVGRGASARCETDIRFVCLSEALQEQAQANGVTDDHEQGQRNAPRKRQQHWSSSTAYVRAASQDVPQHSRNARHHGRSRQALIVGCKASIAFREA